MTDGWIGRAFASGTAGGNHVAVITGPDADPRARASALGLRNVTFVIRRHGWRVRLRSFTPNEELGLCFTAALAAPVALGASPGELWHVAHTAGTLQVCVGGSAGSPVCWAAGAGGPLPEPEPLTGLPGWFPRSRGVWRVSQARSRIYADVDDPEALVLPAPVELSQLCADRGSRGLVFFADGGPAVRSREFSTVDGSELVATGGAALGIGLLLHARGRTAAMEVVQGGPDPAQQGHLLLRFGPLGPIVGGRVLPLVRGQLAPPA